jgi:hypothetical protein
MRTNSKHSATWRRIGGFLGVGIAMSAGGRPVLAGPPHNCSNTSPQADSLAPVSSQRRSVFLAGARRGGGVRLFRRFDFADGRSAPVGAAFVLRVATGPLCRYIIRRVQDPDG